MADFHERLALLKLIQSQRRTTRRSLAMASFYAAQVVLCASILLGAYRYAHARGVYVAIISTCLCVQPVLDQAIGASAVRIAANFVGGMVGVMVAKTLGDGGWQTLVGLVVVCFVCEWLRLDLGLRTACVTVTIVMLANIGNVMLTSEERCLDVFLGCGLAVGVQYVASIVRQRMGWAEALAPGPLPHATTSSAPPAIARPSPVASPS